MNAYAIAFTALGLLCLLGGNVFAFLPFSKRISLLEQSSIRTQSDLLRLYQRPYVPPMPRSAYRQRGPQ